MNHTTPSMTNEAKSSKTAATALMILDLIKAGVSPEWLHQIADGRDSYDPRYDEHVDTVTRWVADEGNGYIHWAIDAAVNDLSKRPAAPAVVEVTELANDSWDDHGYAVSVERRNLDLGIERAIIGCEIATKALDELVSDNVFDVEYTEGGNGPDMRAHLEAAFRELRAARRIAEAVNRA